MRSQATKPLTKKGALSKTTFKPNSPTRQIKKKFVTAKKVKNLVKKSLVKSPKKKVAKDDWSDSNTSNGDFSSGDKTDSSETAKSGSSKTSATGSDHSSKKNAGTEPKEKKVHSKPVAKKAKQTIKRTLNTNKKTKTPLKSNTKTKEKHSNDIKYKIKTDIVKKASPKNAKPNAKVKKVANRNKNTKADNKQESDSGKDDEDSSENRASSIASDSKDSSSSSSCNQISNDQIISRETMINEINDVKSDIPTDPLLIPTTSKATVVSVETPKSESERPPKFFTSSRSPRTVDIDVKCSKTSKGNLVVSERFISLKAIDTKTEEIKDKPDTGCNLIAQGSEIDVYTFTEKVDSPKSILSDFRNPINKTIGRVRPIARVKGTIIDKKIDPEKKKYSPHRPIEEVVKQLKANKRSEELKSTQSQSDDVRSSLDSSVVSDEKDEEDKPKPIISKSYKMVARKSSIPGKPFSPIKFLEQDEPVKSKGKSTANTKKTPPKPKAKSQKSSASDEELENSKFSFNTNSNSLHYSSSDESVADSNDDTKESSGTDSNKNKKNKKIKKYKRITDSAKKCTSKELKELSKDSLVDLKDESEITGKEKPSKRRLKLMSMWAGPKKHRMASLNAIAKVHCLYENESRTHMELGLMKTIDRVIVPGSAKPSISRKKEPKEKLPEKEETTSESEYERKDRKEESSEDDTSPPNTRSLRGVPGIRSAGKYWDPKSCTSSSDDSELDSKKIATQDKKKSSKTSSLPKSDSEKPHAKMKKTAGVPVKKKRNRNEIVMDLKDMVVQKRMASLNATAILAASYEKRSPKSNKDETTSDSCSDESFSKSKNGVASGLKSETKIVETKKEVEDLTPGDRNQKVEVIVNQDTDVTITGVYSTHLHEGFCTVSGMQYRISSTSHTQTTATANCEKEGCSREEGPRYTPLNALSSMQPPADHAHSHNHPGPIEVDEADGASPPRAPPMPLPITNTVPELGGLARRAAGCSSAFSAPSPAPHHEPGKPPASCKCSICVPAAAMPPISPFGYYQPAGPLIKETGADADRALARFHPAPHYHAPHPTVLPQYGPPYYPTEMCYARAYYGRPPAPYHMPPSAQPDAQMVGVGGEPYPAPQYYGGPPCYQHQHSPQRMPQYIEYHRGCPCPMNACPKNVLIGPATGKAPAGGGPADVPAALAPPGGAFRVKVRAACAKDSLESHGSGKDPPLELEPPAAADAPRPCPFPAIGGASPKRELYDARDNLRLVGDMSGSTEAAGPPSPARGSAGACAPQPPPVAPRRARLGKAMARRSLAGDDTGTLISAPQPTPGHSDGDDDVLAISPPLCAPIDLSSSDETDRRSTPLVDVKKENEGPMYTPPRKTETQALKEHNCSAAELIDTNNAAKAALKRRYSKPKLEIELGEVELEDGCKTNGIGEHVKLQKRRKVSSEQIDLLTRTETVTAKKVRKKSSPKPKRSPKSSAVEKKSLKRKLGEGSETPQNKKQNNAETVVSEDARLKNVAALPTEQTITKPKNKSALLLDNLLRKNSIDRADSTPEIELNPAELFLAPRENISQNCTKKTLNINNNVIENSAPAVNGVRPNTIAAVTQMIGKKLAATKNALRKVESKVTSGIKSVLQSTDTIIEGRQPKLLENIDLNVSERSGERCLALSDKGDIKTNVKDSDSVNNKASAITDHVHKIPTKAKKLTKCTVVQPPISVPAVEEPVAKPLEEAVGGDVSTVEKQTETVDIPKTQAENLQTEKICTKRSKLSIDKVNGEHKAKSSEKAIEKVAKLLVSKKSVIKTDEAAELVEDACFSPITVQKPSLRRARRRRSGPKRVRRIPASLLIPPTTDDSRAPPRWSNGWQWDGEPHISKVYLNNDSRQDRTARCWSRMTHASGDKVARGDCVLLRASSTRAQPFVARVARLWENPDDGEMMVSLVWYYRPEHTERGRQAEDAPDEVFASRHRDANSVACIEDKCYVLTFNEYCRYRKRLKAAEEGLTIKPSIVPPMPAAEVVPAVATNDTKLPPAVSPELVLFCRKIYDFRSKKIQVPNK